MIGESGAGNFGKRAYVSFSPKQRESSREKGIVDNVGDNRKDRDKDGNNHLPTIYFRFCYVGWFSIHKVDGSLMYAQS